MLALLAGAGPVLAQTGSLPSPRAPAAPRVAASPAPSTKDVVRDALAECMRLWDPATHMTRREWSRTCKRIQTRLDNLKIENLDTAKPDKRAGKRGRGG